MARITDLEGDKRMRYVLIFKNHGEGAGAHTISHSISQLMALAVIPRSLKTKLMVARDYFALKERCIYCDVLQQELKGRRLIAENADFVAFAPFASRFPFEMGVFPKSHSSAFSRISPGQIENLARILRDVLQKLDHTVGGPPYNLALQDRPFLRTRAGYWTTIEDDKGVGGAGTGACSGDLLLGALAACAQITCQMVAAAMGIPTEGINVTVEGELDLQGTLGISKEAPVGFQSIRVIFDVRAPHATVEQLSTLQAKTEQYCVVMQTLQHPPRIENQWKE